MIDVFHDVSRVLEIICYRFRFPKIELIGLLVSDNTSCQSCVIKDIIFLWSISYTLTCTSLSTSCEIFPSFLLFFIRKTFG